MKPLRKRSARLRPPEGTVGHTPVLQAEIVAALARSDGASLGHPAESRSDSVLGPSALRIRGANPKGTPGAVLIDATVGDGGHAAALLRASGAGARLLGLDLDPVSLREAAHVLAGFGDRVRLLQGTFADMALLAREAGFSEATGILLDLGLRSGQLSASRGFSFQGSSALDMRFDPSGAVPLPEPEHAALRRLAKARGAFTAADILRRLREDELADVLWRYGDETHARAIARAVVSARRTSPMHTTSDLVRIGVQARPPRARHGRLHAATRTFQALRIAVNREFESLTRGLEDALGLLARGGRLAVIAYHSGEDRIVKRKFREAARTGRFAEETKHPLVPSGAERMANPRSRSAKLRIIFRRDIA